MSKPEIHAKNSARKWGGTVEDYTKLHNFMDSSKSSCADNRHRALFHHSFGCFVLEKVYGIDYHALATLKEKHRLSDEAVEDILQWKEHCTNHGTAIKNSDGKEVQVRDIAEQHIAEDFGMRFIPTVSDYLNYMRFLDWMQNGYRGCPDSHIAVEEKRKAKIKEHRKGKLNIEPLRKEIGD